MKEEKRKELIRMRKYIIHKDEKSHRIYQKIIEHERYQKAKNIGLYYSLKDEVSTLELIQHSLKVGKKVYLPKVVEDDLLFYEIGENESFVQSPFHVMEPVGEENKRMVDVDIMIVPGVAFDEEGHRMGFGKGYYDRFLEKQKVYKIGVCFREQMVKGIPYNSHDISMDEVITD